MIPVKAIPWEEVERKTRWFAPAPASDIILSSRIRIARNLEHFPFPHHLDLEQANRLTQQILEVLTGYAGEEILLIKIGELRPEEKSFLVERHLVSPEFTEDDFPKTAVLLPRHHISLMILEEDHLRIQGLHSGLALKEIWTRIGKLEGFLDAHLRFAFSEQLGYLTACPTNLGTGLRASCLLHLPALIFTGAWEKTFPALEKSGLVIRGFYGEGTEPAGNIFQVSTGKTLGKPEEEIIHQLQNVVELLSDREQASRPRIKGKKKILAALRRELTRLKKRGKLSSDQALGLLSCLVLGKGSGLVDFSEAWARETLFRILPAHIQMKQGRLLTADQRDRERAKWFKKEVGNLHV